MQRKAALVNRKRFIYELENIPADILRWYKSNKKLTKAEKHVSAFLQACMRYGYVKSYTTQQIILLGDNQKYIMADFFLSDPEVIIEVDGPEHEVKKRMDEWRDHEVKRLFEYTTIRVTNDQIAKDNHKACRYILEEMMKAQGYSDRHARRKGKEYLEKRAKEGY